MFRTKAKLLVLIIVLKSLTKHKKRVSEQLVRAFSQKDICFFMTTIFPLHNEKKLSSEAQISADCRIKYFQNSDV